MYLFYSYLKMADSTGEIAVDEVGVSGVSVGSVGSVECNDST